MLPQSGTDAPLLTRESGLSRRKMLRPGNGAEGVGMVGGEEGEWEGERVKGRCGE